MSLTLIGMNRQRYKEIETPPSRFNDPQKYRAWAARADAWAFGLVRRNSGSEFLGLRGAAS